PASAQSGSPVGSIVGGLVGALVALIIAAMVLVQCRRGKRGTESDEKYREEIGIAYSTPSEIGGEKEGVRPFHPYDVRVGIAYDPPSEPTDSRSESPHLPRDDPPPPFFHIPPPPPFDPPHLSQQQSDSAAFAYSPRQSTLAPPYSPQQPPSELGDAQSAIGG